ncbi:olfactory receptor 4N2-like [Rhineura floridana]|uniref:olfactory receptor 4N2-like n=1 Tax=Rhineura floridana TaxID=261503 RepID=UPI002AC7E726|nr:olfactory receptor 4N2-like [Rhineura floridana]
MEQGNRTTVTEFIFLGLSSSREVQLALFFLFLILYISVLLGNLLLIVAIQSDPRLNCPMYFFLAKLAFLDICYCSVTSPKALKDFFSSFKAISYGGCMAQVFLIHFLGAAELLLLVGMAFDRYMAVCRPLHYASLVNPKLCWMVVVAAWTGGLVHAVTLMSFVTELQFCGLNNTLDSFYCDIPQVAKLACASVSSTEIIAFASNEGVILPCFLMLIASYCFLLLKLRSYPPKARSNVTSTCITHVIVIVFMFSPAIYIYWYPFRNVAVDKSVTVFHTMIFPLTNPVIYTLRNKEVASSMKRMIHRYFLLQVGTQESYTWDKFP